MSTSILGRRVAWASRPGLLIIAAALMSGCGGGGNSGPDTSTADFPVAGAVSAYATVSHQFNLAGSLDGVAFTMRYTYTPDAASVFEGRAASTAMEAVTMNANGMLAAQSTSRLYFALSPYVEYGSVSDDGGYMVFNQTANLPTTAKVGQSGPLGTATEYVNSTKTQIDGTTTASWSLDADTASTALFCINQVMSGGMSGTGAQCYRLDTAGQVLGMLIKIDVNGKTLTLQ
jgi:hypothetical protein